MVRAHWYASSSHARPHTRSIDMSVLMNSFRMLRLPACALLAAGLGGCLTTPGPTIAGDGLCKADDLQWAVGKPGDEENMRRLRRESGAGLINPITPTTIVSRDIRQDRLRVFLDESNVITAVRCE